MEAIDDVDFYLIDLKSRFDNMKKLNSERMKKREVWKVRWCKNA